MTRKLTALTATITLLATGCSASTDNTAPPGTPVATPPPRPHRTPRRNLHPQHHHGTRTCTQHRNPHPHRHRGKPHHCNPDPDGQP